MACSTRGVYLKRRARHWWLLACALGLFGTQTRAEPRPQPRTMPQRPVDAGKADVSLDYGATPVRVGGMRCVEQPPQAFLIRTNWFNNGAVGAAMAQQAVRYRTEKYGFFRGFGRAEWNPHPPGFYAVATTFMGLPLQVHKRIVPALKCVEQALKDGPGHLVYTARGVGGIRYHNTYHGGEVSNHVYGIAMDIDSDVNTCCGCVGTWNQHPLCRKKTSNVYDRTALPATWVKTFERFGFYWLGHDAMQDTMHFEFLGDPDKSIAP